ncbi:MAG TPA: hypothetical protein VGJ80_02580 [Gemmatimonadales bacterium]
MGRIERPSRCVGLTYLEIHLTDSARGERVEHVLHERTSQPVTSSGGGDREVEDLAFVRGIERDDVAGDCVGTSSCLGDEKEGI